MQTTNHKTFEQAQQEAYEHYRANTYGISEYMKQDFKAGFAFGWNFSPCNPISQSERRQIAAMAMQGILANGTATCSAEHIAQRAIEFADELINQLNTPKQ